MSTVKTRLAGGEVAKTFLVGIVERGLEIGICALVGRTGKPSVASMGKDTT